VNSEIVNRGCKDESTGIGEANLPQLQDHPQEARGAGDLQGSPAQAEARLSAGKPLKLTCKLTA
jgi:hypothetical protein